jgi:hypothetical protein
MTEIRGYPLGAGKRLNEDEPFLIDIEMPMFATILHIGEEGEESYVWAKHTPGNSRCLRRFFFCKTHHIIPMAARYYICAFTTSEENQWHIYDGGESFEYDK